MPEFKEHTDARQKRKLEELAPYIEKAFARKKKMRELTDDEIPNVIALGRQITQQTLTPAEQEARKAWSERSNVPLEDPANKAKKGAAE
jgi:D-serine dehydratase